MTCPFDTYIQSPTPLQVRPMVRMAGISLLPLANQVIAGLPQPRIHLRCFCP
jgi:hypothetical protein